MGNSKERVCAIYTRVSTEEQAKKGYSLSEQKKRLTDYCEYNDFISSEIKIIDDMIFNLNQLKKDIHLKKEIVLHNSKQHF